jgi:hypothetical protein
MKAKYLCIWALCISTIFLGGCATLLLQEISTDPSPVVGDRTPFTIHLEIFNETNQTFDDIQLRVLQTNDPTGKKGTVIKDEIMYVLKPGLNSYTLSGVGFDYSYGNNLFLIVCSRTPLERYSKPLKELRIFRIPFERQRQGSTNVYIIEQRRSAPSECGTNLDCFIDAAKKCAPAQVRHTATFNLFGMLQTTTTFLEIRGGGEKKCLVYMKTEKNDIKFSDELIQKMLADGTTKRQIRQQEQEADKQAGAAEGLDAICNFNRKDLISMVQRWKEGGFSTTDWEAGECEGSMFGGRFEGGELPALQQLSPDNGAVFSHPPHHSCKMTLEWSAVPSAQSYTVEIDCFHCCKPNEWCTDVGQTWKVVRNIKRTSLTFNFLGAQPGRWRVWAVGEGGREGTKSEWREFQCTVRGR